MAIRLLSTRLLPTLALLCVLLPTACSRAPEPAPATVQPHDMDFLADNAIWQMQRREKLLQPDGWTSLVGLHWIELKAHYVGSSAGSGIRLAKGPPRLGLVQQQAGRVFLTPEAGAALTLDGKPLRGRVALNTDADPAPSVVGFDDGKGLLTVIERGGRRALRVRHADADGRLQFRGLDYWPADAGWRIEARFEPHSPGRTIEIANIVGIIEPKANPGAVVFERDGGPYRLEAIDQGDGGLFLIFADRTSGHGSYGAGRYLDAPAPDAGGRMVVDFNRAYNPPCAFTAFATCPLPPPENRLDLAVTVGEKEYRGGAH